MLPAELLKALKPYLDQAKVPLMEKLGRFTIVSAPWRKEKRKPTRDYLSVTTPYANSDFHFVNDNNDPNGFDESEVLWEGDAYGHHFTLIKQK